jgi:hypothetical protein
MYRETDFPRKFREALKRNNTNALALSREIELCGTTCQNIKTGMSEGSPRSIQILGDYFASIGDDSLLVEIDHGVGTKELAATCGVSCRSVIRYSHKSNLRRSYGTGVPWLWNESQQEQVIEHFKTRNNNDRDS